jgi:multicomponent Na+:H+ antiporter subunit C
LPHLLILTAIVVGVGVLGVGLSLLVRIHATHGTFDEAIVADRLSGRAKPLGEDASDAAAGDVPRRGRGYDAGQEPGP